MQKSFVETSKWFANEEKTLSVLCYQHKLQQPKPFLVSKRSDKGKMKHICRLSIIILFLLLLRTCADDRVKILYLHSFYVRSFYPYIISHPCEVILFQNLIQLNLNQQALELCYIVILSLCFKYHYATESFEFYCITAKCQNILLQNAKIFSAA